MAICAVTTRGCDAPVGLTPTPQIPPSVGGGGAVLRRRRNDRPPRSPSGVGYHPPVEPDVPPSAAPHLERETDGPCDRLESIRTVTRSYGDGAVEARPTSW